MRAAIVILVSVSLLFSMSLQTESFEEFLCYSLIVIAGVVFIFLLWLFSSTKHHILFNPKDEKPDWRDLHQ